MSDLKLDVVVSNSVKKHTYMDYETKKLFWLGKWEDFVDDDCVEVIKKFSALQTDTELYQYVLHNPLTDLNRLGYIKHPIKNKPKLHYIQFSDDFYEEHKDDKEFAETYYPTCKKTWWKKTGWDATKMLAQYLFMKYYWLLPEDERALTRQGEIPLIQVGFGAGLLHLILNKKGKVREIEGLLMVIQRYGLKDVSALLKAEQQTTPQDATMRVWGELEKTERKKLENSERKYNEEFMLYQ